MSSQSSALAKRSSESALMPPPPPPKRQRRPATVLDEDVYSESLSHIIARDFFPGLLETEVQRDFIEALESNDSDWIRDAGRKLTHVMTPGPDGRRRGARGTSFTPRRSTAQSQTPRQSVAQTPLRTPTAATNDDFAPERTPEVDLNLSLGAFQAKYTSEDNESFNALLDKQNEKHAANYAFFHSANRIPPTQRIECAKGRPGPSDDSEGSLALVRNTTGEERRLLTVSRPSQDLDARPASVDSFPDRQGPRNSFMFGPDRVDTHQLSSQTTSNVPLKAVQYSATRFRAPTELKEKVPASPSLSAIDAAIAGRPKATDSEPGYSGSETPRVNGYAFVDEEPTPSELGIPVQDDEADAVENEIAKAFLPKLDGSGPGRFSIAEQSRREDLHHRLVEKADASRRRGGRLEHLQSLGITTGHTPTPRSMSSPNVRKSANMTPAAKRLANSMRTPQNRGAVFGMKRANG